MIKVSLDFTDDIRDIIKRVLLMRKDLKKAKNMAEGYNGKSIFAGSGYKSYDMNPQTNRPDYTKVSKSVNEGARLKNQSERYLMDLEQKKREK